MLFFSNSCRAVTLACTTRRINFDYTSAFHTVQTHVYIIFFHDNVKKNTYLQPRQRNQVKKQSAQDCKILPVAAVNDAGKNRPLLSKKDFEI